MHLIIIIAFAALLWFNAPEPMNLLGLSPEASVLFVAGQLLLIPGLALICARRTLAVLRRHPDDPDAAQHLHHQCTFVLQLAIVGLFVLSLILTAWPGVIHGLFGGRLTFGLSDLLILSPFLLNILLVWIVQFPPDRGIRELALHPRLAGGHPVHPVWSLGQYLSFNIRYHLLTIALPMTLIIVGDEMIDHYRGEIRAVVGVPYAADILMGALVCCVFVLSPVMLRYVWATEPFPPGSLRDRLVHIARGMNLRYRNILIWHSQGMVVNAAVMGLFAPLRYVLISDGLIESMSDRQIEAVFGHEAGHVKCWHIPYFILFATLTMLIAGALMLGLQRYGPGWLTMEYIQLAVGLVVVLLWAFAFGWLSHQFEHQADLSGAMSITPESAACRLPCLVHAAETAAPEAPLCATAAEDFARALQRVALLNGIPTEEKGWRHPSIGQRIRLLHSFSRDRQSWLQFVKTLQTAKVVLVAGIVLGVVGVAYVYRDLWPQALPG